MSRSNGTSDLPPHSLEAEQGVLGCVLIEPRSLGICSTRFTSGPDVFYDVRHRTIYQEMHALTQERRQIDIVTLSQRLIDRGKIENAGGLSYLSTIADIVPSSANLTYYIDIVREKYALRSILESAQRAIATIKSGTGGFDELMFDVQSDLLGSFQRATASPVDQSWDIAELVDYKVDQDPNAVIGFRKDRTATRYLCRGYGAWIIGPSGAGKSSLIQQMGICWALGRDFCGIAPIRPLRVLVVQAENDKGDAAEQAQGVLRAMEIDDFGDELEALCSRLRIVTERRSVGQKFCLWLEQQIIEHRADVVFVDPFLSFAGIDVSRQDQCSQFLRAWMNPILADTGTVLIATHHTGKPRPSKDTKGWTVLDHAYAGLGSSELVNWARAVCILRQLGPEQFELMLAKRGKRAGALTKDQQPTTNLYLQHAKERIYWEQIDDPEPPKQAEAGRSGGRPSKVDEILAIGLGSVIDSLTEPVSKNEVCRRIQSCVASKLGEVSKGPISKAVDKLLKNSAIKYDPETGYSKP